MNNSSRVIMSPPDFFDIEYSINPWMNTANKVNHRRAAIEWNTLRKTYEKLGLEVVTIPAEKGLPDLVFTTDHGAWIDERFYACNFRYPERIREQSITLPWLTEQGIKPTVLPTDHYMEGGDIFVHNETILVGHGFRTSKNTANFLSRKAKLAVISLELIDESYYHLDTCLFPLDDNTAFFYPPAFTPASIIALNQHFPNLIDLQEKEAREFACNSVVIGKNVLCQSCPSFEDKLMSLGYKPIVLSTKEFNKSGGGIHCLTQILN